MTNSHETGSPIVAPYWSTASFGHSTDTTPMDLSALGDHVSRCRAASSRFGGLQCAAQAVHGMVASRFVTTLALTAALIGIVLMAL
jgi:hypothetical protein